MSDQKYHQVAVLMGGPSSECDVSIKSGKAITRALVKAGYDASGVVADKSARFDLPEGTEAVFMAVHGEYGEDGRFQQMLHSMRIPYTGTIYDKMNLSYDKIRTKEILKERELPTAEFEVLIYDETEISFPVVLKPALQGSSIGIEIVDYPEDFAAALKRVQKFRQDILVEKFIAGRELTVGILGDEVLPIVEIIAPKGRYDFKAKYSSLGLTQYVCPAEISDNVKQAAEDYARQCFDVLGCRHLGRVDFRMDEDENLYILECNSLPGFTETSLMPKAALAAGISFEDLCSRVMEMAQLK